MGPTPKQRERYAVIADAIGIAHFIVANLVLVIGNFTNAFDTMGGEYPALRFVLTYLDAPVYQLMLRLGYVETYDFLYSHLFGEFVIIVSSVLYGLIALVALRLFDKITGD